MPAFTCKTRLTAWVLSVATITGLTFLNGCETTKFNQQTHGSEASISKDAGKYWKKEGWWSLKQKTGKVMITEFSVEYITETEMDLDQNRLGLLMVMDVVGVGDSKREYDENFKRTFPTKMYEQFVQALTAQGYTVMPMREVTSHPEFSKIAGAKAGSRGATTERKLGIISSGEYDKASVYPTPGLPTVDDSWFKGGFNAQSETKVAGELGADVALRVRIRVGVDDDGYAMLAKGSTIRVIGGFKSAESGALGTSYWAETNGMVVSTHGFLNDSPVASKDEFRAFEGDIYTVNTARFGQDILEMFPTYAKMGVYTMKK